MLSEYAAILSDWYVGVLLAIGAGSQIPLLPLLLVPTVLFVFLLTMSMMLPQWVGNFMGYDHPHQVLAMWIIMPVSLVLAIGSLISAGIMGIIGIVKYEDNFRECVQTSHMAIVTELDETYDIYSLFCRDRAHVDDEWGEFTVVNTQLSPFIGEQEVSELP